MRKNGIKREGVGKWLAGLILLTMFLLVQTAVRLPVTTAVAAPDDVIIYGSNGYFAREMVEINLTTNTFSSVGTVPLSNRAIAQDPATNYIYYYEWLTTGNEFGYWNPATGANTIVRTYTPSPGFYAVRMDFAPDGTLYVMDDQDRLYAFNKQNGNYTLVGSITGMVTGAYNGTGDIAFAPDGTLYANTYENLYTINIATRQATLVASNMINITNRGVTIWEGLSYCNGLLYASHVEQTTSLSAIFQINPASGATTLLFYTNVTLTDLTSCTAVPEVPTATPTNTPVPPTATATPTSTSVPPTATATNTAVPPTATSTNTPAPPTATHTPIPSTATATNTAVPPTATSTNTPTSSPTATSTPVPPTATASSTPLPATATPTNTPAGPACTVYTSSSTPVDLPEGTASISSDLSVSGSGIVSDVNVNVDITHAWVGDLVLTLNSPAGINVTIVDQPGVPASTYGCGGSNITATLDDSALLPVEDQCGRGPATINGTFAPTNALSVFNGQNANGTWTLQIDDAYPVKDGGTLIGWSVEICSNSIPPTNTPVPPSPTATNTPPPTPTPTTIPPTNIIYGSNSYGNQEMVAFDTDEGTYEVVGTVALPTQAMGLDPLTGYVYYFEWQTSGNEFGYWNPATGTNHIVRVYNPAPGFYAKRMAFAPNGTLYLMDSDENLYTINKLTGNLSLLGYVSGMVTGSVGATGDMAFAPDGTLYVNTYENLYTVDLSTLHSTLIAEDMLDLNQPGQTLWTGLGYCNGYLYATDAEESLSVSALYRIDPVDGTATFMYYTNLILNDLTSCLP